MMQKNVFKLWQSMDDYNEAQLYGKLNEHIDWSIYRDIAEGKKNVSEYKTLHIKLRTNKVLKKDLIQAPGGAHFISQKFKDYFGAEVFEDSILLHATINDVPYFAWLFAQTNNCFIAKDSQIEEKLDGDTGERVPLKYVFDNSKVKDNRFFKLPDENDELYYCDEIIGRKILASDLNLIAQSLVYEEKNLRKRVTYTNPVAGINFEEPENYLLECKQYKKLLAGKKLSEKDWAIDFKEGEKEIGLLSMYRKQILISINWQQKAEIHIGLTTHTAQEYFEYRGNTKPYEFEHKDIKFESRLHEYDWQIVLVAPWKNNLNLYVLVINRTCYATDNEYMQEALNVVKKIKFLS